MTTPRSYRSAVLIILGSLLLSSLSLLSLRSVAPDLFASQLLFFLIGLVLIFALSRLDYALITFSPWPWYLTTLGLLGLTFLFGTTIRGSTRWFNLAGYSLQTSEIAKPFYLLFLAIFVTHHYPTRLLQLVKLTLLLSLPILLVFIQPDLGTAIVYGIIALSGLIAAGIRLRHLLILALGFILLLPLVFPFLKPYQRDRLHTFINQDQDPQGTGYNSHQAQIAVGAGQIFGRGLGQGTQSHLRFLPERQTDFIYASIAEELGFVGGSILLSAYICLALGLIEAAKHAPDEIGAIICLTSLAAILLQAFINIGMNLGVLPVTGITLPLVSAGGSSIISLSLMIGLCLSIAFRPQSRRQTLQIR